MKIKDEEMTRTHFGDASRDGVLFVHGGQDASGRLQSGVVVVGGPGPTVDEAIPRTGTTGAGGLSHHASAVLRDKYLVSIGGWDGRKRSSEVLVADLDDLAQGIVPFSLMKSKACVAFQWVIAIHT